MRAFIIGFLILATSAVYGQSYNDSLQYNPLVDSIAEKLVAMAMNNPRIQSQNYNAISQEFEFRRNRTAWLNNIAVAANVNEFSLQQGSNADPLKQSTQYPRYNIGVIVPLGIFVNNPKATKAAYYRYESVAQNVKTEQANIRKDVLTLYENYKLGKQMMTYQQETLQDTRVLLTRQEEKFAEGEVSLEEYTATTKLYNEERSKLAGIIRDLKVMVADMEVLIGMNIEVAIDQIKRGAPAK